MELINIPNRIILESKSELIGLLQEKFFALEGYFIAGGSVRSLISKEKINDYDFFFKNEESLKTAQREIHLLSSNPNENSNIKPTHETKNAITYRICNKTIQFIRNRFYPSVEELFEGFDYHLGQFAYIPASGHLPETKKQQFVTTFEGLSSVLTKTLTVNKFLPGYELDSLRRAFKYNKRGYFICDKTLKEITSLLIERASSLNLSSSEQNQEVSPSIIRFD